MPLHKKMYKVSKEEAKYSKSHKSNNNSNKNKVKNDNKTCSNKTTTTAPKNSVSKNKNKSNNNNKQSSCDKTDHFMVERDQNTSVAFNYESSVERVGISDAAAAATPFDRISIDNEGVKRKNNNIEQSIDVAIGLSSDSLGNNLRRTPPTTIERDNNNSDDDVVVSVGHDYENINFDLDLNKKRLLQKFFRSTEKSYALYENLCRGCGYGVFGARGYLCNFCECIVHGVGVSSCCGGSHPNLLQASVSDANANIYENICEKCSKIYSDDECSCIVNEQQQKQQSVVINSNDLQTPSEIQIEQQQVSNTIADAQPAVANAGAKKVKKSKSFNKRIFHNIIGSLKRAKPPIPASPSSTLDSSASSNKNRATTDTVSSPRTRKHFEIVHNVDGYENVFHTRDTFDMQRICELKRSQTSCSDQHIYGRVKGVAPNTISTTKLSQSHDQLLESTPSENQLVASSAASEVATTRETVSNRTLSPVDASTGNGRNNRITKPRRFFFRSNSQNNNNNNNNNNYNNLSSPSSSNELPQLLEHTKSKAKSISKQPQALYLADSVCQWMTSLRNEIHNYQSCGQQIDDHNIALCTPKSVPAKNTFEYFCASGSGVTNAITNVLQVAPSLNDLVTNYPNIVDKSVKYSTSNSYSSRRSSNNSNNKNDNLVNKDEHYDTLTVNSNNDSLASDEIVTLRRHQCNNNYNNNNNNSESNSCNNFDSDKEDRYDFLSDFEEEQHLERSPVEQMVQEFKRNLITKQMQQQKQMQRPDGANADNMLGIPTSTSPPLSSAATTASPSSSTAATTTTASAVTSPGKVAQLRSKRQAIYLKTNDNEIDANVNCDRKQTDNNHNHNNNNNNSTENTKIIHHSNGQVNAIPSQHGLRRDHASSRRAAQQAVTALSKRCGIYERDSEFVNDILSAFETFLQRETADEEADAVNVNENEKRIQLEETRETAFVDTTNAADAHNESQLGIKQQNQQQQSEIETKSIETSASCEHKSVAQLPRLIDEKGNKNNSNHHTNKCNNDTGNPPPTPTSALISSASVETSKFAVENQKIQINENNTTQKSDDLPIITTTKLQCICNSENSQFKCNCCCFIRNKYDNRMLNDYQYHCNYNGVDIARLINNLSISFSLNTIVLFHSKPLSAFLHLVQSRTSHDRRRCSSFANRQADECSVRNFKRFLIYCEQKFLNQTRSVIDNKRVHKLALESDKNKIKNKTNSQNFNSRTNTNSHSHSDSDVRDVNDESAIVPLRSPVNGSARSDRDDVVNGAHEKRNSLKIIVQLVENCGGGGNNNININSGNKIISAASAPLAQQRQGVVQPLDSEVRSCEIDSASTSANRRHRIHMHLSMDENVKSTQVAVETSQSVVTSESKSQKVSQSSAKANSNLKVDVKRTIGGKPPTPPPSSSAKSPSSASSFKNYSPPPRVPVRDPKTILTTTTVSVVSASKVKPLTSKNNNNNNNNSKSEIISKEKMTVPTVNMHATSSNSTGNENKSAVKVRSDELDEDEGDGEGIYQPIWKFKTVGEAQERYPLDADYYESSSLTHGNESTLKSHIMISNHVDDHGEWETDDEFMFSTQLGQPNGNSTIAADANSLNGSTTRSVVSSSSTVGSTVTGFNSSTATLASAVSQHVSLTHHLFRNIGIFYSLTEPNMRAIVYEYDRVHASVYFAKQPPQQPQDAAAISEYNNYSVCKANNESICTFATNDSGIGKSPKEERKRSPMPPPRSTSMAKVKEEGMPATMSAGESAPTKTGKVQTAVASKLQLLPDSVQAWKFMLLDVNYIEDEEDMIVSEAEILRAQQIKKDIDTRQPQPFNLPQRFKSASIGNLVDLPNEDDKKSIAKRVRNKYLAVQRGVFKLNMRSPKSEKKSHGIFRRAEATSLYLEDGMKPKYPIFGAPLEQLELNVTTYPNVPRFVVDCVEYIERKDCITYDGLYRASGNKVSIDELKQKLSESYIYDPKLLITDDIHTLTSLLKLFFRELGAPLIPQETYKRLGPTLNDAAGIETMRKAFSGMREPNYSTLKFLIKHLTNVAAYSSENRMPASNLAIVWGPCILSANQIEFDIGRMNTLAKVLIENYDRIFEENERLVS